MFTNGYFNSLLYTAIFELLSTTFILLLQLGNYLKGIPTIKLLFLHKAVL